MAVDIGEMLDRLLTEGARHSDDAHDYQLTMVPLGDVTLPTGRVVACDPLARTGEALPFTVGVPPGRYPLRAWVAVAYLAVRGLPPSHSLVTVPAHPGPPLRNRVEANRRTAALHLVIRDEPITSWEPAVVTGPAELDEDGFVVHPVDTGLATLTDERALKALSTWDYAEVEETFVPSVPPEVPGMVGAVTDPATGANVVAVEPGCGDGAYASFVGRTAAGEVAAFVTDFRVI
ncbi:DUF4241 domain-containing protein [Couchioplanes caeruleus]|uniref:DUF4241 domain-containing protein n=1 Tax=Couchioplanes caeruleus TaxID=56438 RepID=UPI0020C0F5A1|nr:DUF4241 domain-containing protein [Couchioplanes caeruleus]UQU67076.1 DUF4241 domain-containing protein [Couchioplanes caeruleus]